MARSQIPREALNEMQITIISANYCRCHNAWEIREDLEKILCVKGENKFYIYKHLCKQKEEILKEDTFKYIARLPTTHNRTLLDDLSKKMLLKKLLLSTERAPLAIQYGDKYFIEFAVYK